VDWDDYEEYGPQVELLQAVGLLAETGFPEDAFAKWAPAYKSPHDFSRSTTGTRGNTQVRNGTHRNESISSIQFNSVPEVGGPGEGESPPQNFMGFPRRSRHDGQHPDCRPCEPIRPAWLKAQGAAT
jgi:hypothetical protein